MFLGAAAAQTRNLSQIERDRGAAAVRAQGLRAAAERERAEAAMLGVRLVESGRRRAEAEAAAGAAEQRLAALRRQTAADRRRQGQNRDAFEAALIMAAMVERRASLDAFRAGLFARAAAPELQRQIRGGERALDAARRLDSTIAEEQAALGSAQAAIEAERAELERLLARRRAAQTTLTADAAAAEARVARFAAEARNLRELTERVRPNAPRRAAAAGAGALPAAWLAPVEGRIASAYGARAGAGPASQGVTLRTRARAQVVAPASGEIAYAGPFRGYGQVLILNLDGGYAIVLTGLEAVRARVGERVEAGQPIGEMPNSDIAAPELYVEVRRNGQPIDPARWLNARGLIAEQTADRRG